MSSTTPLIAEPLPAAVAWQAAAPAAHSHIPALDGVRGLAILLVVAGHISESVSVEFGVSNPIISLGQLGWAGVDLFFVLSGFLITGILWDAKERDNYFRNFYVRRSLRIFPLYYAALVVVALAALALPAMNLLGWENPAWLWIYAANYKIALGEPGMFGVLDHFWSLAVEEHFYLVWPAIVYVLDKRALMRVACVAIVVALLVRISCIVDGEMTMAGYMMTHARMDSLAAGALIALAARDPATMQRMTRLAPYVLGLASAALAAIIFSQQTLSYHNPLLGTIGISLLWTAFGSLLILSLTWKAAANVMSTAVMRWFGKYSYGLYVWHPPVFVILLHTAWARDMRTDSNALNLIVSVGVSVALLLVVVLASFHLLEKQMLKLKKRFA